MKPKERIIKQINHQETDFVPYARLGFEREVEDRLDEYYGNNDWKTKVSTYNHISSVSGADRDGVGVKEENGLLVDRFGTRWRMDARPFHLEEPGLKQPDLTGYKFPDVKEFFPEGWKEKALIEIEKRKDYFTVVGFGFGLFERTWAIRGFADILIDCIAEPVFYQELVERVAELQMEMIDELLTLPADGIWFSDDWSDQRGVLLGPVRWRQFIKPYLAMMYERVHKAGKYTLSHCCGNAKEIIPDLIEIGLDVIESVQPEAMNPYELKKEFGRDMTFFGGLGSQRLVPFGTPAEIKEEVKKLCFNMAQGGGYILGPAKALQPETPTENAVAVVEAFLQEAGVETAGLGSLPENPGQGGS